MGHAIQLQLQLQAHFLEEVPRVQLPHHSCMMCPGWKRALLAISQGLKQLGHERTKEVGLGTQAPPWPRSNWSSCKPLSRRLTRAARGGSVHKWSQGGNLGALNLPTLSLWVRGVGPDLRLCRQQIIACSFAAIGGNNTTWADIMGMLLVRPYLLKGACLELLVLQRAIVLASPCLKSALLRLLKSL